MKPRPSNIQAFSIAVPGIANPVTSDDVSAHLQHGLLSTLPVSQDSGRFDYSEGKLGALLGVTQPVIHHNLDTSTYTRHLDVMLVRRGNGLSLPWSVASVATMLGGISASMIYRFGQYLPVETRGTVGIAAIVLLGLAGMSYLGAVEASKLQPKRRSYSYLDTFTASSAHVKWKEYWQGMMVEGCDRKKLKQVGRRAKEFGFGLRQLRKPRLSTKRDGMPLSGADVWRFMMYNDDSGFAAITRFLWSVEAARRDVGKSLRMEIRAVPTNAKYFLKLAEALTGVRPEGVSLPRQYSEPLADLLDGAAFYAGLGNDVPTQSAALAALLGRYYFDRAKKNNASLMMLSMKYALMGRWSSAYETQMSALKRPVDGKAAAEQKLVSAIHHLGIARLIQERIIDGYGHEVIPGAYAYAYSAARAFNALAYDMIDAPMHCQLLQARALDIMRVMSDNGPFVEFR